MRRNANYGLKYKIWTTIIVVSLIMITIGTGLTYYLYEKFYVEKQKSSLVMQGEALKSFYTSTADHHAFLEKIAWTDETSDATVIFTDDPMLLSAGIPFEGFADTNLITFEERQRLLNGEQVILIRKHPRFNQEILAVTIPLLEERQLKAVIFLYMPLADIYEPFQSIRDVLVVTLVIVFILIMVIGLQMINHIIKPLKKMEDIAGKMSQGDFSRRIKIMKADEIGNLAHSFNVLAASLEEVDKKRREFLQNVSHELRTPLSYIKGYTEAINDGLVSKEDTDKYITIIQNEVERLTRIVNDLLDLAQLEDDSYPIRREPLPFAQLILDVVERFQFLANQKNIEIILDVDEDIIVNGDADRLEQVVSNVIDNALRYTSAGEELKLCLEQEGLYAKLFIKDTGPGIPEEALPYVFERFYRVNKSRTRKEGGTGIGLSIVYQIVKRHDGDLRIESVNNNGTTVTIMLPLYDIDI
ncbi:sensor histidine kinase [Radiobacillus sp. PE A8.2]|uniref:sensor histidine kinase n=1 Tax=Radiobacillus sp. PE A8.2 TaxID=3380349 RepID=UPI00388FF1E3